MSTTKAIVRHLLNSSSLPRFQPYPTCAEREARGKRARGSETARERETRATRATRCKTLPVNFIALGASSCTPCTRTGNRRDQPPRLLIRSGANLTATFRRVRARTRLAREGTRTRVRIDVQGEGEREGAGAGGRGKRIVVVILLVYTRNATVARVFTSDGGWAGLRGYKCHRKITF